MGSCQSNKQPIRKMNTLSKLYTNRKSQFFKDSKKTKPSITTNNSQKVEIHFLLKNMETGSYSAEISLKTNNTQELVGKTNVIEGSYIDFKTSYSLFYNFEKEQILSFIIKRNYCVLQNIDVTLGKLIGAKGQTLNLPLLSGGDLIIQAKPINYDDYNIEIIVSCNLNYAKNINPFFILKREITSKNGESNKYEDIYKSEIQIFKPLNDYIFNKLTIDATYLNDNDNSKPFLIEVCDAVNNTLLGNQQIIIDNFSSVNNFSMKYFLLDEKGPLYNYYIDLTISFPYKYKFIDYIRGGLNISLIIGIDFSSYNKPITDKTSLHYSGEGEESAYEKAFISCGKLIANYDYDQMFPVFGFGAILPRGTVVEHCFNVNFTYDPNIHTIDNIRPFYKECLNNIIMKAECFLAPFLNRTINLCRGTGKDVYYILLILTNGMIDDFDKTKDLLVEASNLPISVIIVGVGEGDFNKLINLDSDKINLMSSSGETACRDIVQFVEFRKFSNDGKKLSEEILKEIPMQIESYYRMNKKLPNRPIGVYI